MWDLCCVNDITTVPNGNLMFADDVKIFTKHFFCPRLPNPRNFDKEYDLLLIFDNLMINLP